MVTKRGKNWHYNFNFQKKRYNGVCHNCKTKSEAQRYEQNIRETVTKAAEQKTVTALIDNFRQELTGGTQILLSDAFDLASKKPRKRKPNIKTTNRKRAAWNDFLAFLRVKYEHLTILSDVNHAHAEEYASYIVENGKFDKYVSYTRKGKVITSSLQVTCFSAKTVNDYIMYCKEIFTLLARDAGITFNPFAGIPKIRSDAERREPFTESELNLIFKNCDDFMEPLFILAISTALREGDICMLRWSSVNFDKDLLCVKMRKTGKYVEIPVTTKLKSYLLNLPSFGTNEYVLPEHAAMYSSNPSGVSARIINFLNSLGIITSIIPPERSRAVSIKDLHSCRHTFAYYAAINGIPLVVVQSILGHDAASMTLHYSDHATLEDKRRELARLNFNLLPENETDMDRQKLKKLIDVLTNEEVKEILERYSS